MKSGGAYVSTREKERATGRDPNTVRDRERGICKYKETERETDKRHTAEDSRRHTNRCIPLVKSSELKLHDVAEVQCVFVCMWLGVCMCEL